MDPYNQQGALLKALVDDLLVESSRAKAGKLLNIVSNDHNNTCWKVFEDLSTQSRTKIGDVLQDVSIRDKR